MLLARRLAFAVGKYHPIDWAKLRDSHTPYEWAVQEICQSIDPIGEERADMRSAAAVFQIVQALLPDASIETLRALADGARNYLAINAPKDEPVLTPEQAAEYKARKR
jgi:hypothetical protein